MPDEIASHRLGEVASVQTGPFGSQLHASDYRESGTPIITVEHLGDNEVLHRNLPLVSEADRRRLAKYSLLEGDVVFSRVGAIDRRAYVSSREDGWLFSGRLLRVRLIGGLDAKFISHLLGHHASVQWIRNHAVGSTMPCLNTKILSEVPLRLPPLPEQRRIAEILDTVDEAIRKTEEIIAKLKQVKQGLLHDLLTRGIDDNGELRDPDRHPEQFKDSPLGRVPKAWQVAPLGAISDLDVGYAFKSEWFSDTDGIRLLRGENVGHGSPDWSLTKRLPEEHANRYSEYRLNPGDVVIGMDRTFTKSGVKVTLLAKSDVPALLVQRVGRFVPNIATSRQFVLHLLRWPVFHQALLAQQKGMDIPHLSKSEILAPLVPVPPKDEQGAIATRLDGIDLRSEQEGRALAKLRRVKAGLMEDLLTGRVRTAGERAR